MEIKLKTTTTPPSISRKDAAALANRSISSIDKAIDANQLDFGTVSRLVLVVNNSKWADYLRECRARDWCNTNSFHHASFGTLKELIKAVGDSKLFNDRELRQFQSICKK